MGKKNWRDSGRAALMRARRDSPGGSGDAGQIERKSIVCSRHAIRCARSADCSSEKKIL
jgi:hypothetical protein